jgi:hypothetical protein
LSVVVSRAALVVIDLLAVASGLLEPVGYSSRSVRDIRDRVRASTVIDRAEIPPPFSWVATCPRSRERPG